VADHIRSQITGITSNQGKGREWLAVLDTVLEKGEGVCVFFTEGSPKTKGVEQQRYRIQGEALLKI
jgi:hypothetical protein